MSTAPDCNSHVEALHCCPERSSRSFLLSVRLSLTYSWRRPVDATHVPTFYVPQHEGPSYINVIPSLLFHVAHLIVCGCIFGGIHCAGWNFHSPTDAEQTLWHVASVAVTVIPTLLSGLPTILDTSGFSIEDTMKMAMIFMLMYLSARLILLGQAIALLHQPPGTFTAVDWAKFYHFL